MDRGSWSRASVPPALPERAPKTLLRLGTYPTIIPPLSYHYPTIILTWELLGITMELLGMLGIGGTRWGHVWDTFGLPYAAGCWPDAAGPGTSLSLEV